MTRERSYVILPVPRQGGSPISNQIDTAHCPHDNGPLAMSASHGHGPDMVRVFWCPYCEVGFVLHGERTPGKAKCYRFATDAKTRTMQVDCPLAVQLAMQKLVERQPNKLERLR